VAVTYQTQKDTFQIFVEQLIFTKVFEKFPIFLEPKIGRFFYQSLSLDFFSSQYLQLIFFRFILTLSCQRGCCGGSALNMCAAGYQFEFELDGQLL
jgi:hypothetical protein